jgi:hypothetical protein
VEVITWVEKRDWLGWWLPQEIPHPACRYSIQPELHAHNYLHAATEEPPELQTGDKVRLIFTRTEIRALGLRRNRYFGRQGSNINPNATLDEPLKSRAEWTVQWEAISSHEEMYGSGDENYELAYGR